VTPAAGSWGLRALVLGAPLAAVACTWAAAGRAVVVIGLLVVVLAAVCAGAPDSHLGLAVVGAVVVQWLAIVDDPATPWSIGAAAALGAFHTAAAAATVAPPGAPWTRAMRARWARRGAAAAGAGVAAWLVVALADGRGPRGAGAAAVVFVVALASFALVALAVGRGAVGPARR
jgi:hypothetical protein